MKKNYGLDHVCESQKLWEPTHDPSIAPNSKEQIQEQGNNGVPYFLSGVGQKFGSG